MKLFLLAFIVGICVVFSVPKSFSADVIKQEAKEKLEKKQIKGMQKLNYNQRS